MQWHMPIGYKVVNGRITVYEEHRKIVEEIFRDYDSGISASRIAEGLRARAYAMPMTGQRGPTVPSAGF